MKKNELYKIALDLGIDKLKAEKIILNVTGLSKSQLFLCEEIEEKFIENIKKKFERLVKWEPIEYVINKAEFYSLDFFVDNRVLIPRNDTEVMVEEVINTVLLHPLSTSISPPPAGTPLKYKGRDNGEITLIDVGTWSSCIGISIMKKLFPPPAGTPLKYKGRIKNCYVLDISDDALIVSKINIEKYELSDKISQIKWDLLEEFISNKLKPLLTSPCHGRDSYKIGKNVIITANLPYVKNDDFDNMDKETIFYEPKIALFWWEKTWFELYEKLIEQCFELKNLYELESIILFIEIGFDQKEYSQMYLNNLWLKFEIFNDNSGIERCIKIYI